MGSKMNRTALHRIVTCGIIAIFTVLAGCEDKDESKGFEFGTWNGSGMRSEFGQYGYVTFVFNADNTFSVSYSSTTASGVTSAWSASGTYSESGKKLNGTYAGGSFSGTLNGDDITGSCVDNSGTLTFTICRPKPAEEGVIVYY